MFKVDLPHRPAHVVEGARSGTEEGDREGALSDKFKYLNSRSKFDEICSLVHFALEFIVFAGIALALLQGLLTEC